MKKLNAEERVLGAVKRSRDRGMTLNDLARVLDSNYATVQAATARLRSRGQLRFEQQGRTLRFWSA